MPRKSTFAFSDEQKTQFVARYENPESPVSASALASEVGCSVPTMIRYLRAWGANVRGKGRLKGGTEKSKAPLRIVVTGSTSEVVEAVAHLAASADAVVAAADKFAGAEGVSAHIIPIRVEGEKRGFFGRIAGFMR